MSYLKHVVVIVVGVGATVVTLYGKLSSDALMLIYGNIMMYVFKNGNDALKKHKEG